MAVLFVMRKLEEIIIHCSATPEGRNVIVDTIRKWHKQRGWRDIGYHYVIYLDGSVHEARPLSQTGAHVAGRNTGTIGICYIGGLDQNHKPKDTRTTAQKQALKKLLVKLTRQYPTIKTISGHSDYSAKACPCFPARAEYAHLVGSKSEIETHLPSERIAWLQRLLKKANYNPGKDDGIIGAQTKSALRLYQKDMGLKQTVSFDKATVALLRSVDDISATKTDQIVEKLRADNRVSTTDIAAGIGGAAVVASTANELSSNLSGLLDNSPIILSLMVAVGALWWVWRERRKYRNMARNVEELN